MALVSQRLRKAKRRNAVSVGYCTLSVVKREEGKDGIPILTFSWLPEEISILTKGNPAARSPCRDRPCSSKSKMKNSLDEILALALSGSRRKSDDRLVRRVSLIETLNSVGAPRSGRVREMFESTSRIAGNPVSNAVPFSVIAPRLTRDMTAGAFASGGAFVPSQMQDGTPLFSIPQSAAGWAQRSSPA